MTIIQETSLNYPFDRVWLHYPNHHPPIVTLRLKDMRWPEDWQCGLIGVYYVCLPIRQGQEPSTDLDLNQLSEENALQVLANIRPIFFMDDQDAARTAVDNFLSDIMRRKMSSDFTRLNTDELSNLRAKVTSFKKSVDSEMALMSNPSYVSPLFEKKFWEVREFYKEGKFSPTQTDDSFLAWILLNERPWLEGVCDRLKAISQSTEDVSASSLPNVLSKKRLSDDYFLLSQVPIGLWIDHWDRRQAFVELWLHSNETRQRSYFPPFKTRHEQAHNIDNALTDHYSQMRELESKLPANAALLEDAKRTLNRRIRESLHLGSTTPTLTQLITDNNLDDDTIKRLSVWGRLDLGDLNLQPTLTVDEPLDLLTLYQWSNNDKVNNLSKGKQESDLSYGKWKLVSATQKVTYKNKTIADWPTKSNSQAYKMVLHMIKSNGTSTINDAVEALWGSVGVEDGKSDRELRRAKNDWPKTLKKNISITGNAVNLKP